MKTPTLNLTAALVGLSLLSLGCHSHPCCGPAQPDAKKITTEIQAAMHQSAKDWTADDLDAFMRAFHNTPDITFAIPTGITTGWGPLKERYARSIDKSALWFTDIQVTPITSDTALCFARFHNEMDEDKSYSTGLTTLLMKKIDGNWVIIHDHSSGLPADTPRKDQGS